MTQPDFKELVRQTPFSFIGTVEILGGAMSSELPIDDHTGVARVDLVLHAPVAFEGLVGHGITVQFSPDENLPVVGEQLVLFARGSRSEKRSPSRKWGGCRSTRWGLHS